MAPTSECCALNYRYREALTDIARGMEEGVRADPLQELHTIHNLLEVQKMDSFSGGLTLAEASLSQRATLLRTQYSSAQNLNVAEHHRRLDMVRSEVEGKMREAEEGKHWFLEACDLLGSGDAGGGDTLGRVEAALSESQGGRYSRKKTGSESLLGRFSTFRGLGFLLDKEVVSLFEARDKLVEKVVSLSREPTGEDVSLCGNCGDCKANLMRTGPRCPHCKAQDLLDAYKNKLFHHHAERRKDKGRQEGSKQVAWWAERLEEAQGGAGTSKRGGEGVAETMERKASEIEVVMRLLVRMMESAAKGAGGARAGECAEWGKVHLQVWDSMKREFDKSGLLWRAQRERLEKLDELGMATMRIRLRYDGEVVEEGEELYKLFDYEVPIPKITNPKP